MTQLTVAGLADLLTRLARLGASIQTFAGAAHYREAEMMMAASKRLVPIDMGTLWSSGHVQATVYTATGGSVTLGYGGAASGYAVYVHEGTGPAVGRAPFMPPVAVIEAWAKRHGIPKDAAFSIARAIGRRGLRPLKYLEGPVNAARVGFDARVAAAVRRDIERTMTAKS